MRAVVDVRFSKRTSPDHGAPRRTPAELHPRPSRGFIIDRQGYIVTHDRTVSGASAIQVTLHDGRTLPAAVAYCESPYEAAGGADAVALVTEWNEFKFLNLERLREAMRRPVVFDGRNLWEPERMRRLGFEYYSIGRKPVLPS